MPPDAPVLGFDTSAAHCAAAVVSGDRVLAAAHEDMARGQAERLMPLIEQVLADAGIAYHDLAAIGVGTGPGNFTGIRVSVSAARGLALALGIPAIGVSVLEALAHGPSGVRIASVPAPRGTIYAQVIGGGGPLAHGPAESIALECPPRSEPACIGAGADVLAARFAGQVTAPREPLAVAIARIADARRFNLNPPAPTPIYVRPADAAPASDPPPVILP